jgi:hypothetical protein
MTTRYKRPDLKNAQSILDGSKREFDSAFLLKDMDLFGSTIVRNIYESFRMLGDSILVSQGISSSDHLAPINELLKLKVNTKRPIALIDSLRILRHNINYYGYNPRVEEVEDFMNFAQGCYKDLFLEVKRILEKTN